MLHCEIRLQRRLFTIDVELEVKPGETLCLFGASASGKTSILHAIAGLEPHARATVAWKQSDVHVDEQTPTWRRGFALVAQQPSLFPHMSVKDNILFGVRDSKGYAEALDLAGRFGLHQYLTSRPKQLSGGLAQRVNLVRALAASPRVLLLDEPLSALDAASRRELQDLLRATLQERQLTTILVTHQLSEA
ncbi:MAG: ATP-binding cassette domain-containing protein [Firmicutes bacterium]|nr:ATP-binding cassette domain-containing protein [Bacillota bacterium]